MFAIAVAKLTEVVGALGIEAMGGLLEEFRDKKDDTERARLLQKTAENSAAVREIIDDLLKKIDALPLAQQAYNQQHDNDKERKWFNENGAQSMAEELKLS